MARRKSEYPSGAGDSGYERDPLVDIKSNSNARPGSSTRRSLPAGAWGGRKNQMDTGDPRKTECYNVSTPLRYYIDCDDNRSE